MTESPIRPVGIIHSCFREKFGIPRQPGLAPAATATLELLPPWNTADAVRGLEQWSHLWLVFQFHQHVGRTPSATVRPPRLGGNQRCGVFATRSSFRPNHLGLSVVLLSSIEVLPHRVTLHLAAVDLLDGTPVFDIKPYVPYSDSIADARTAWAESPPVLPVTFTSEAETHCQQAAERVADIRELIIQVLQQDPRPAYHDDASREYRMKLWHWDVVFCVDQQHIRVLRLMPLEHL